MADREQTARLYTKHKRKRIKQHTVLQDPRYKAKTEKTKKERIRDLDIREVEEAIEDAYLEEYIKGVLQED